MLLYLRGLGFIFFFFFVCISSQAQLGIRPAISPEALVQKLIGDGVAVSNVSFIGDADMLMAGHFKNISGTNINLDSGIVLTTGRARQTVGPSTFEASTAWGLSGDKTLAAEFNIPVSALEDACVLEFDFVPLGDTIKFRYVFSSEEYVPEYVCSFNDAFGFFISGPGIVGERNIALVPGSALPVSIFNVNNVPPFACVNNPDFFINNSSNQFFSHEGHTIVFTALARVQPCETYHMKLVISDNGDAEFDSGVFLEAKSLTSNAVTLVSNTQVSQQGDNYLVEGCVPGLFTVSRPVSSPLPLTVNLRYAGTALNGVDIQPMPLFVTIPANQTSVNINIIPIIDNLSEGIEFVKVYSLAACATLTSLPIDSTIFQIRDYDTLGVFPDTSVICKGSPVQLNATNGYTSYSWTSSLGLNNANIQNPVATTISALTTYIATAMKGTCNARDSALIRWKVPDVISTTPVLCAGASSGSIVVAGGSDWIAPLQYSINNFPFQSSGTFNNLPVGNHLILVKDAAGCIDSIRVPIVQSFPNLTISDTIITPGTCNGAANGSITVRASGGNGVYQYSTNGGTTFQNGNVFNLPSGMYNIVVRDGNGCKTTPVVAFVDFVNSVELSTTPDTVICESESTVLRATTNAQSVVWTPSTSLSMATIPTPVASPVRTTTYYITATTGVCSRRDSITVNVNPAPSPNAGPDVSICFGGSVSLLGSGAKEYSWSPSTYLNNATDAQPVVVKPTGPITYYLSVRDMHGCNSLTKDTVKVNVTPAVKMFAGKDTLVAVGQPLQLNAAQVGANTVISYSWSPSYGLNNVNSANPVAVLDRDISYTVKGTTALSCEGSDVIKVKVYEGPEIYVPSVFTPNNDGLNDKLKAWAIGMKEYRYFKVFNRWGVVVHSSSDFVNGWDGRLQGLEQTTGTFVWVAEAVDFRGNVITRKGTVTLIR